MRVVKMNEKRVAFVNAARGFLGEDRNAITRTEIFAVMEENSLPNPSWIRKLKTINRGEYFLPTS